MREVDDALREDEMLGAFKRWGMPIGVAVAVGLLGLAAWLGWEHFQNQQAGERGEQLTLALDQVDQGKLSDGDKQLAALAGDAAAGPRTAARLSRAAIALQQNRQADAIKLYGEVAADAEAPQPLRDLAKIRGTAAEFDTLPPDQVISRLKPMAAPGNPWFGSAAELVGMAYLKQNKRDLAGPLFAAIARDETVPDTLRNRGRQMAGLLGFDAIDDVAKSTAGTARP